MVLTKVLEGPTEVNVCIVDTLVSEPLSPVGSSDELKRDSVSLLELSD